MMMNFGSTKINKRERKALPWTKKQCLKTKTCESLSLFTNSGKSSQVLLRFIVFPQLTFALICFNLMLIGCSESAPSSVKLSNMLSAKKLVRFAFPAGLAVLNLLPLVASADEHARTDDMHSSNKVKIYKVTPQLSYEMKLHGFLLWASVGFLMPVSILIKRMSNREASARKLRIIFYIHAITQVLAVLVAAAGGIMSIKYFDNSFRNDHQRIGLVFYGLIWLQTLVSIFRPGRGSKGRSIWFLFHWLVGIAASLLGAINIYTGLQAYHKRTSKDVRIWTIIFVAEMSFILFVYLLQEKWHYMKKQGMIIGDANKLPAEGNII